MGPEAGRGSGERHLTGRDAQPVRPISEQFVTLEVEGTGLHGVYYEPLNEAATGGLVVCDAFAEEKKCSHRSLVELARALAGQGWSVLRFDYRGCGDSEREFADFGPAAWERDIVAACDFARGRGVERLVVAGLRLGATLASRVAETRDDVAALALWEPITDGKRFVSQNLRRSLIKAMLTEGEGFDGAEVAARHEAEVTDFDGYLIPAEMRAELEALRLESGNFAGPVLVLNIGPRQEPSEAMRRLAEGYPQGVATGVRLEPLWNRIGLLDPSPLIEATESWLRGSVGGGG